MAAALTTAFNPPSWCQDRFVVFINDNYSPPLTHTPTSGWVDPSYTECIPSQYTTPGQTLSPGMCFDSMTIATTIYVSDGHESLWLGGCCKSGFVARHGYTQCIWSFTTPMDFLLYPDISTADIYTALSSIIVVHDMMAVAWEESDLDVFPPKISSQYRSIMEPTTTSPTESSTIDTAESTASFPATEGNTIIVVTTAIITPAPTTTSSDGRGSTSASGSTTTSENTAHTAPSPKSASSRSRPLWGAIFILMAWSVLVQALQ